MKGVVFTGGRELELMDFPDPTPGEGDVVIEMKASGMCGSDLHQYRRPKGEKQAVGGLPANPNPVIAGHEPCGIVAARGAGVHEREARIGARVMVHHYQGCTSVRPLPLGMEPALSGAAGKSVRQQRQWRPRQIFVRAGQHTGTAAG